MKLFRFQKDPINAAEFRKQTGSASDGAVVSFDGFPRGDTNGKKVLYLEYELYESMAEKEMKKIIDEAMNRWPVTDCIVVHRYGRVEIGETSILICVSAPHRGEAFDACRYIIDTVKKTVPIWKKEFYTDGSVWKSDRI